MYQLLKHTLDIHTFAKKKFPKVMYLHTFAKKKFPRLSNILGGVSPVCGLFNITTNDIFLVEILLNGYDG